MPEQWTFQKGEWEGPVCTANGDLRPVICIQCAWVQDAYHARAARAAPAQDTYAYVNIMQRAFRAAPPRASLFRFTLSYANRHNIITALTRRAINLPYLHIIYNVMLRVQYVLWVLCFVPPSEVGLTTYLVNKWTVDNLWNRVYTKTTSKNIYNIFSPNLNTLLGNTHIMLLIM